MGKIKIMTLITKLKLRNLNSQCLKFNIKISKTKIFTINKKFFSGDLNFDNVFKVDKEMKNDFQNRKKTGAIQYTSNKNKIEQKVLSEHKKYVEEKTQKLKAHFQKIKERNKTIKKEYDHNLFEISPEGKEFRRKSLANFNKNLEDPLDDFPSFKFCKDLKKQKE